MKIITFAAIYIGSYEVSLKIFELAAKRPIRQIDYVRARVELGMDSYQKGVIGYELVEDLGNVLMEYKKIMEGYRVDAYEAYAGEVLRDTKNELFVLDQIYLSTGIRIQVLSNSEHRFISYKSVAFREEFDEITKQGAAVVDVGGSSLQITLFSKGKIVTTQNMALGSMRLREQLLAIGNSVPHYEKQIEELVNKDLAVFKSLHMKGLEMKYVIFMGDYITELMKRVEKKEKKKEKKESKENKESKEYKECKESRENKDSKQENKADKESKESKENKDSRENKEYRECMESKQENKAGKESKENKESKADKDNKESKEIKLVSTERFVKAMRKLYKKNVDQIAGELNLSNDHDPLLVPYLVLYTRIAEELNAEEIWAPGANVSDGMACHYAEQNHMLKPTHDFDEDILSAAKHLSERYDSFSPHIDALTQMATLVFDAMKKHHGMGKRERLLLQVAAILHDCGKYVSLAHGPECAYNIIMESEIMGLSHLERQIVAYTVLYNTYPLDDYEKLADRMDQASYMTVAKLSSILRVSNAMDRSHKQKFRNVKAAVRNKELVITIETADDIILEKGLFDAKAGSFEQVFSLKPVIREKRVYL